MRSWRSLKDKKGGKIVTKGSFSVKYLAADIERTPKQGSNPTIGWG